jgi:small subunit ribosomal protein S11
MGKKRIATQSEEEAIKEGKKITSTAGTKKKSVTRRKYESGRVYVNASYNNTHLTVTDNAGNVITWMSAGALGFKGPKKATPFAATKVAEALAEKLEKSGPNTIEITIKGIGSGRDGAVRSLANKGFNITAIKDATPIPHNGPRPPKPRRV